MSVSRAEPSTGARPLRRTIQRHIQDGISEILIQQHADPPIDRIDVDLVEGQLKFLVHEREAALAAH